MSTLKVLIVEDQPAVATALQVLFEIRGIPCATARAPWEAIRILDQQASEIGVVVQDMNFSPDATSGAEGVVLFREIRRWHPSLPVLLITAWTSLETAVKLVKEGASDYLAKPWDDEKLLASARNLLRLRELQLENARLRGRARRSWEDLAERNDLRGAVWASEKMHAVVTLALQVARGDIPVLITGPSGAGKEKLAEIVQANSRRRDEPFVKVNAGALPDELLESELFGAEAGAYTGATRRRVGRFEAADGGTLFLDEIGNLSASGQAKLLRVLQSGQFERLGSSETRRVDVRLICATNADLRREIALGRFREDLYYRLNVIELHVPPLAERPEDVVPLAERFLRDLSPSPTGAVWRLDPEARERLVRHSWPGNVRELENTLRRAVLIASGDAIRLEDLGLGAAPAVSRAPAVASAGEEGDGNDLLLAERVRLERALEEAGGVVAKAAESMGLSRQAFYRKMEKHGLAVERRLRG
ncbi:MAG TPA: sigma-54 dependent transcriptional regulator [Thermoanaerobaculia bacterium]|jgi:DNA-binding NtrC family response regulator|nr:sigma-54 dependent transcriptional regulator [Thermoanaerobaculia bacterium]